jgi:hypothetical protein
VCDIYQNENNMAALENIGVEYIQSFLSREGSTIKDLSEHLKEQFPNTNGFSTRSIERFCKENDIRRKGVVSDETLDALVEGAVSQVRYCDILLIKQ